MKKILSIIFCMIIVLTGFSSVMANDTKISVYVNNEKVEFDVPPMIINGRTMVPIRAVCEMLGADVYWWEEVKMVVIVKNDIKIFLSIDYPLIMSMKCRDIEHFMELFNSEENPEEYKEEALDSSPVIHNGRTLLPIRAVCEQLGAIVGWDSEKREVSISSEDLLKNTDLGFFDEFIKIFVRNEDEKIAKKTDYIQHIAIAKEFYNAETEKLIKEKFGENADITTYIKDVIKQKTQLLIAAGEKYVVISDFDDEFIEKYKGIYAESGMFSDNLKYIITNY